MNKEILEITKEFHDTYEKLASEYTYETREDTKVFDINSNNGKLMYATVNEIVSPILKENKILRENAENNDKVVDNVNWENMLLKKENKQIKDNWNELKEYIKKCLEAIYTIQKLTGNAIENYTPRILTYNQIKDKMQELEKGSDSDE